MRKLLIFFLLALLVGGYWGYSRAIKGKGGKIYWSLPPPEDAPVLALKKCGDLLIGYLKRGQVFALVKDPGEKKWEISTAYPGWGAKIMVVNERNLVVWDGQNLWGVDIAKGKVVWKHDLNPTRGKLIPPQFLAGKVLYVENIFESISLQEWKRGREKGIFKRPYYPHVKCSRRSIFSSVPEILVEKSSAIYCLDPSTGKVVWLQEIDKAKTTSLFASKSKIFLRTASAREENDWVWALNPLTGKKEWKMKISTLHSLLQVPQGILVKTMKKIYFVSEKGQKIWSKPLSKSSSLPSFLSAENVLAILGWMTGGFYLSPDTSLYRDSLYLLEENKKLVAISIKDGKKLWEITLPQNAEISGFGGNKMFLSYYTQEVVTTSQDTSPQLGLSREVTRPVPHLLCLDMEKKKIVWERKDIGNLAYWCGDRILVIDTTFCFSHFFPAVRICVLEPKKGKVLWRRRWGGILEAIEIDDNCIYIANYKKDISIEQSFAREGEKPSHHKIFKVAIK